MILYSVFDTTAIENYKHISSSNNLEEVYKSVKGIIKTNLNYNEFVKQFSHKVQGQLVFESDKDYSSAMVIITYIERK